MSRVRPRRSLRARWTVLVALLAATCASPAAATEGAADSLSVLEGQYRHVGGDRDRRGLEAAIDRVVDRMSLFIQAIARDRIREALAPEPRVAVDVVDDGHVRLELGAWRSPAMPVDGTPRTVDGPDGTPTRYAVRHHAGRLYTRAETGQGTREMWLTPVEDGGRLLVQVRVSADRLPAPVEYALSFARAR